MGTLQQVYLTFKLLPKALHRAWSDANYARLRADVQANAVSSVDLTNFNIIDLEVN